MAQKPVTVSFNSSSKTISVSPDPVKPKKNQDGVTWTGSQQFKIKYQGNTHTATGSGTNWTVVVGTFNTLETIKYDVTSNGYSDLDPEIEVVE